MKKIFLLAALFCGFIYTSCIKVQKTNTKVIVGAENLSEYLDLLKNKKVGLVVNHTSLVKDQHLVDVLLQKKVQVTRIFAPEHGFRGEVSAGEKIENSKDEKTGISVISLYGKNKKPTPDQLIDLDVIIFDIQDVGVRFYTFISTLNYVMEACAENDKLLIVLDRPNPNGNYVAGPVLDLKYKSFVGINPIPVVYGLTIGELALMNNGESWLEKGLKCKLKVIKCQNYTHQTKYILPVKPSPNLPNYNSVRLYPSLCLLEPTKISVGRGTNKQFQIYGGPDKKLGSFHFTPVDMPGAKDPVNENISCYGEDLSKVDSDKVEFSLEYLFKAYNDFSDKKNFFTNTNFFNLLIGNDWVLKDLISGKKAKEIEAKWQKDLELFKTKREKYLLYKD